MTDTPFAPLHDSPSAPDLGLSIDSPGFGDLLAALRRVAALPLPVPVERRLSDAEWAEAVVVRGEAPYGRCAYYQAALGAAGCLNLCDMPAGAAREFTNGLLAIIEHHRATTRWVETLGGCICPSPRLTGYQSARVSHGTACPMFSDTVTI